MLDEQTGTVFYRVFQEALTNVARHAQAKNVMVELQPEAGGVQLEICDDGKGITLEDLASPKSLGLLGMQERARLLGGSVSFSERPQGGTVVAVWIPKIPEIGERK